MAIINFRQLLRDKSTDDRAREISVITRLTKDAELCNGTMLLTAIIALHCITLLLRFKVIFVLARSADHPKSFLHVKSVIFFFKLYA